jgi:FkbM family methyltransferase
VIRNKVGRLLGEAFQNLADFCLGVRKPDHFKGVWVDVGAHTGEVSISQARKNPGLLVYAFEPNLALAVRLIGLMPNYVVIPMAVSEKDGCAPFFLNRHDGASSLLPLDPQGVKQWEGGAELVEERQVTVPTIRLDTFMEMANIKHVDFLQIDTQGTDLEVIKSAGNRIKDISKITLEVITTPFELYIGNDTKKDTLEYMTDHGFVLTEIEDQKQWQNLTFIQKPVSRVNPNG